MTANDSAEKTEDRSLNNHAALKTSIAKKYFEGFLSKLIISEVNRLERLCLFL